MPETTPLMLHSEPRRRTRVGAVALAVLGACAVFALASVASEQTASKQRGVWCRDKSRRRRGYDVDGRPRPPYYAATTWTVGREMIFRYRGGHVSDGRGQVAYGHR